MKIFSKNQENVFIQSCREIITKARDAIKEIRRDSENPELPSLLTKKLRYMQSRLWICQSLVWEMEEG